MNNIIQPITINSPNHLEPISLDYKGEPIIIGNLKPEFELTISWD